MFVAPTLSSQLTQPHLSILRHAGQERTPRTSIAAVTAGDAPCACCPGSGLPRSELERESAGEVVAVSAEAPASVVQHTPHSRRRSVGRRGTDGGDVLDWVSLGVLEDTRGRSSVKGAANGYCNNIKIV